MSISIPESYVEQFSSRVHMLSEQQTSRLRGTVNFEAVTGESFSVERIGQTADAPAVINNLHGDTPLNNTPHTRRWGFVADYDVADLIAKQSQVKMLIEPNSKYVRRHSGVMGRGIDDAIIGALGGSAAQGKNGTTTVALPSGQKLTGGSTGMTLGKLIEAKERLDAAEVDEFIPRHIVMTAKQFSNLLADDKLTSQDFATVKALVRGEINEFMGFTFHRSQRLLKPSSDRLCYAWAQEGVTLGMGAEPNSVAGVRPDKRNNMQIYTWGSWGAVRSEDEMVIEIPCTE